MNRPTLRTCINALLVTHPDYPRVAPSEEEADVAAVLESVEQQHDGDGDVPDELGFWGRCRACDAPWPCESWRWAQMLAVQFLGRAMDRVFANAPGGPTMPAWEEVRGGVVIPLRPRRTAPPGPSEAELLRHRYPPDGDVDRWVREGPPGHINYPGKTEEPA